MKIKMIIFKIINGFSNIKKHLAIFWMYTYWASGIRLGETVFVLLYPSWL